MLSRGRQANHAYLETTGDGDHRLDSVSLQFSTGQRPLPWLPPVPKAIADPEWGYYLNARYELAEQLAAHVRTDAEQASHTPGWARALVEPPSPEIVAQIELWRAAHQVTDNDLRPTGPAQHHLVESPTQHRLDGLIASEAEPALNWLEWIHEAAPATVEDPATIRVARECAEADPDGTWLREHVQAAAGRSLPDDHKADALRYRLEPRLNQVWESVTPQPPRHDPRREVHHHTPRHSPRNQHLIPPLLGIRRALVMYDLTTLHLQIEAEDQLRKVGMSKERRADPQVTVGLLVTADGFPLEIAVFEGNKAETKTLIPVITQFTTRHQLGELVVVADAGMLSAANLNALEDAGCAFIVGSRQSHVPDDRASTSNDTATMWPMVPRSNPAGRWAPGRTDAPAGSCTSTRLPATSVRTARERPDRESREGRRRAASDRPEPVRDRDRRR